ncbi:MAG TPA: nuclear transport factor 2 family protein [Candidatus Acidoferrales bacterium]|nr:nuclear transport factor 2 family protein [Candidatus Acidoferrales bacterium]
MRRSNLFLSIAIFVTALHISACSASKSAADAVRLKGALQRYQDLILHMDNDGIADLFAEQGELDNPGESPIQGRESIRKFLKSFTEYKVVEESLDADSTAVAGASATQIVRYHQKVTVPSGKTVEVSGRMKINWIEKGGRWLILREESLPKN